MRVLSKPPIQIGVRSPHAPLDQGSARDPRRRAPSAESSSTDRRIVECVARGRSPEHPCEATFDASRHVVLPGLVNAHHHFYQTLTRAHPAGQGLELIPWLVAMEHVWGRMTPEALRIAVRMALVELLLSGCTTAADHHNLFPPGLESAIDIEVDEARKLGMRMTVTRGSMGISQKDGGLQPDSIVQDSDAILEDSERVLKLFHDPRPGAMIRVALAPCSPARRAEARDERIGRSSPSATTPGCIAISASRPTRTSTACRRSASARSIFLRSPAGSARGHGSRTASISTPTRSAGSAAPASPSATAPPRTWRSAWAICPTKDLEAAGLAVGLGVDGSASNDSSNMMEAVRHSLMLQRLRYGPSAVTPLDALRWATEGSARCLGRDDIGRIAPGLEADLALYRLDEPRFSGAQDPIAALALCGAHRADRVMVAGHWRVIDGAPEGVDLEALIAKHKAAARAFA